MKAQRKPWGWHTRYRGHKEDMPVKDKHQQIQGEYREKMNALASTLDEFFNGDRPKKICFCLMVSQFGDMEGGRVNYISNAARPEMIKMLKELLQRWEVHSLNEEMGNAPHHR